MPGLNLTASINFCEGPDFVHSELLAEPVNALGPRIWWTANSANCCCQSSQVVTSFLFYWPVGLVGLLGPKEGERAGQHRREVL